MTVLPSLEESRQPTISVVIPCCNAEPFIEETIRSVINQTLLPQEIIVIDDGSSDETAARAASLDPIIRVISQLNQGVSIARNRGFEEAKGDWIAFLDADDLWEPQKLEAQVKLIATDVVCIHSAYYRFGTERRIVNRSNIPPAKRYSIEFLATNGLLIPSSLLVRKSVRARFPVGIKQAEDMVFSLEVSQEGRIRMATEPLVGYRVHGASATARDDARIHWHKTIMDWLIESGVDLATKKQIEHGWNDRLIVVLLMLFSTGRFVEARVLFKYSKSLRIGVLGWIVAPFRYFGLRLRYTFHSLKTG